MALSERLLEWTARAQGGASSVCPETVTQPMLLPRNTQAPGSSFQPADCRVILALAAVVGASCRAQAYDLLKRQQELETLLAEVRGAKPPEMLLDQTEGILARMKAKLQRSE